MEGGVPDTSRAFSRGRRPSTMSPEIRASATSAIEPAGATTNSSARLLQRHLAIVAHLGNGFQSVSLDAKPHILFEFRE